MHLQTFVILCHLYLSRKPLSFAKRWKAPMGSEPVLRIKTSGVEGDMSL